MRRLPRRHPIDVRRAYQYDTRVSKNSKGTATAVVTCKKTCQARFGVGLGGNVETHLCRRNGRHQRRRNSAIWPSASPSAGGTPLIVDVGTSEPSIRPDVAASEVARHGPPGTQDALASGDRGRAVAAMADAFTRFAASRDDIAGVIGIGGGGGTSIVTCGHARAAARPAEDHGLDARLRRRGPLCRRVGHRHDARRSPTWRG